MDTPLKPEDMNRFAGKFTEAESKMFDQLPEGTTIAVGGNYRKKASDYVKLCFVCGGTVFFSHRDRAFLEKEVPVYLCPTCYFKMEPKEVKNNG